MKINFYPNEMWYLDEHFMENPNYFLFDKCFTYRMKNLIAQIGYKFFDNFLPLFLLWWLFAGPIFLIMLFFEEREYEKVLRENKDEYKYGVYVNIYDEEDSMTFQEAIKIFDTASIDTHEDQKVLKKLNIDKIIIEFLENIGIDECSIFFDKGSIYIDANMKQVRYIKEAFVDLGVEVDLDNLESEEELM